MIHTRVTIRRLVLLSLAVAQLASCKTRATRSGLATAGRRDPLWTDMSGQFMTEDALLKYLYESGESRRLTPEILKDVLYPVVPLDKIAAADEEPVVNDLYVVAKSAGKTSKTMKLDDDLKRDVDLRSHDTPVKNQADSDMCTAFATIAALENVARRKHGVVLDLSERHLFTRYPGLYTGDAVTWSTKTAIVPEPVWPFASATPVEAINGKGVARATDVSYRLTRMSQIVRELQAGNPLVIGATANIPFFFRGGLMNKTGKSGEFGHAMMVVGVWFDEKFVNEGGGVLILKNSYGPSSGDKGYAYMPLDYCDVASGRRCWAWAIRDVELTGDALQDNPANPDPSSPGQPSQPVAAISADDFSLQVNYVGWAGRERIFQIQLVGQPEKVAAVKRVTFKIHNTFGQYATYTTEGENGVFSTDNYRTYARRWRTNGATIEGKNGEVFDIPGVMLNW